MEALTLEEAEQLRKVLYSDEDTGSRTQYLVAIRELYAHGFIVCIPGDILWDNFKEMMQDLGITD